MNMKLSRKGKMASLLLISILTISVISLTLVLGEKPEDPGLPPAGLLAEMLERVEILETDLTNLQNGLEELQIALGNQVNGLQGQIDNLWVGIAEIWDELEWQIADIRSLIAFIDNDIRGDIALLVDDVNELWTHVDNVEANLQNQINDRPTYAQHDADVDGLLNHVNTIDKNLKNKIDDLNIRIPQYDSITVPAASFVPVDDTQGTVNYGGYLRNQDATYTAQAHAGVQLPHGATITAVYFYWFSSRVDDEWPISLILGKYVASAYPDGYIPLITLHSGTGGLGATVGYLTEIVQRYDPYYLTVNIPPWSYGGYRFFYAIIFYNYPT